MAEPRAGRVAGAYGMTLTVPKAGSVAGRSAQVRVEDTQAGSVVAQFGEQMRQAGEALENDYLQREAQRYQTDLTGDMNNLRLEVSQIGDPDLADAAWAQGAEKLRSDYLEGKTEDGRPRVSEKNAERFGLTFDELRNSNAFSLGKQTLAARQSQKEATYLRYAHTATQAGADADPDLRATLLGQGFDQIDDLVASGVIDPAEGERRKLGLSQEVDNARAIKMVAADPDGFLLSAEAGDFAGLPADVQERYRVQAAGNIARAATAAQTEAEKLAKAKEKEIGDRLSDIRDVRGNGMQSVDEMWLGSEDAKNHPDYAQTMASVSLANDEPRLAQLTPSELDAMIAGEKNRPVQHKFQTERLVALEGLKKEASQGWQSDPVSYAQEIGLYVPDLPEFDASNPTAFARALKGREQMQADLVERGYPAGDRYFTDAEQEMLATATDVQTDPASRAALAKTIAVTLSPDSAQQIEDLVDDPVFSYVGGYLAAGGNGALATEIMRGQQTIELGNVKMPPVADRTDAAFQSISAFFADEPDGEETQAAITASADALYASRVRRSDPTAPIDTTVYRQAVHEVLGGTGRFNGKNAKGGMQDLRGALTPLPMGVGASQTEKALWQIGRDMSGARSEVYGRDANARMGMAQAGGALPPAKTIEGPAAQARADAIWQRASLSGGQPGINGEVIDGDALADLKLKAIGPDEYQFTYNGRVISDVTTGSAFVFSLTKLVEGYAP